MQLLRPNYSVLMFFEDKMRNVLNSISPLGHEPSCKSVDCFFSLTFGATPLPAREIGEGGERHKGAGN
jgi:hypothetical protein